MKQQLFWNHVKKTNYCWEWTGYKNYFGYGILCHGPHATRKRERAHRASWKIHNGDVPENLFVLHNCDNPSCVNPSHLKLGTKRQNSIDAAMRMRFRTSRLSPLQVQEIRKTGKGAFTNKEIASKYGVSPVTISHILNGHSWEHLIHG